VLRNVLFRGIRNTLGMSIFFRGITESILSLFRGIFSERNSVPNPRRSGGEVLEWRLAEAEVSVDLALLAEQAGPGH